MFGLGRTIYYLQRYLSQRQRHKNRAERQSRQRSWRAVRAAATQSRLKQKSKAPSTPIPQPLVTKVQQIDLPDKDQKPYDNKNYRKFPRKTLVLPTNFPLTTTAAPRSLVKSSQKKESHQ